MMVRQGQGTATGNSAWPSWMLLLAAVLFWGFTQARADERAVLAAEVQQRIDAFDEIDQLFRALRFKVVNQRSQDHQGALVYADQLVNLAYQLPGLFEAETPRQVIPFSRARPEIWSRKARYDFLMDEFLDNLEEIQALLRQARLTDAGHRIDRTAQSCRRCHDPFRYRR